MARTAVRQSCRGGKLEVISQLKSDRIEGESAWEQARELNTPPEDTARR
jgi:hypothetical protein